MQDIREFARSGGGRQRCRVEVALDAYSTQQPVYAASRVRGVLTQLRAAPSNARRWNFREFIHDQ